MKPNVEIPPDPLFCSHCGARLPEERAEDEGLHCRCGKVYWPATASGVVVVIQPIIREDGSIGVLEVQRKRRDGSVRPPDEGWCFPSGFTKFGHTFEEDGEREVWEESGLKVQLANPMCVYGDDHDFLLLNSVVAGAETATEGHLMVLLVAQPMHEEHLNQYLFPDNRETSARRVGTLGDRLTFSIHRRWKRQFFAGTLPTPSPA